MMYQNQERCHVCIDVIFNVTICLCLIYNSIFSQKHQPKSSNPTSAYSAPVVVLWHISVLSFMSLRTGALLKCKKYLFLFSVFMNGQGRNRASHFCHIWGITLSNKNAHPEFKEGQPSKQPAHFNKFQILKAAP